MKNDCSTATEEWSCRQQIKINNELLRESLIILEDLLGITELKEATESPKAPGALPQVKNGLVATESAARLIIVRLEKLRDQI